LWVGEFGSAYNGPPDEVPDRLRAMDDQIGIFERHGAHWTTWTYKDVGVMGLAVLDPESEYLQRVGGFIRKCTPSALVRQIGAIQEGRISGSS
jgi:endoglucanase